MRKRFTYPSVLSVCLGDSDSWLRQRRTGSAPPCKDDIERFCKKVKGGEEKVDQCLMQNVFEKSA